MLSRAQQDGVKVIAASHQNLYAHSSLLYQGFMIANASMLESRYEEYGVAVNLSGRIHMQHIIEGIVPEIATSSLTVSPCQYGVITLEDGFAQYRTEMVDVSAWAQKHRKTDPNLLDFAAYAKDFFLKYEPAPDAHRRSGRRRAGSVDHRGQCRLLRRQNRPDSPCADCCGNLRRPVSQRLYRQHPCRAASRSHAAFLPPITQANRHAAGGITGKASQISRF